jgi:tRNA-dependent cyclodipeptide synthase
MPDATYKVPSRPKDGGQEIRIAKTTPNVSEEKLFSNRRCYMGISLDNPQFYGKNMEAILSWVTKNFEQCLVVVGDYLRRYNEEIFSGTESKVREAVSFQAGDAYIGQTKEILGRYKEPQIKVVRWKDCIEKAGYKTARSILDNLYSADDLFRAAVQKDSLSFLNRQRRKRQEPAVPMEEAIDISSKYLLEEIAVFSVLSEEGWNVEVYPGPELGVLVEMAKGNFKDIPAGLKKRINVEVQRQTSG